MRRIELNESVLQTTKRPLCHVAKKFKNILKIIEIRRNIHKMFLKKIRVNKRMKFIQTNWKYFFLENLNFKLFAPFPKTFQRRRWRVKNSDETDKLSAKNMLLTLKSEKMKFGMRESKHAMMFGGTSSLKKKRICSKFYIMVKRMLRYFPWVKMNALLYCVLHEAENNFEECCVTPHYSV